MTSGNSTPDIIGQGDGIYAIDTDYLRPRMDASHLLIADGRGAFIDTGTAHSVPKLLAALEVCDLAIEDVDYVLLTHIHLDHAGGAGQLMSALPNATLVVHPRGARHMIDPRKLIAGTIAVYGEEDFKNLYGELLPIDKERVVTVEDGEQLSLGSRELEFVHTPGHAKHHYCIVDRASDGIFTGDSFGLSYRELDTEKGAFIFPTTTPIHFDPDAAHATIDRLLSYTPSRLYLTHYSRVSPPERLGSDMHAHLDAFVRIARDNADSDNRHQRIAAAMKDYLDDCLDEHGCQLNDKQRDYIVGPDVLLNTQGLEFWLDHTARRASA